MNLRLLIFISVFSWGVFALAQPQEDERINRDADNPIAPPPSVTLRQSFQPGAWNPGQEDRSFLALVPAIPYSAFGRLHLVRFIVPYHQRPQRGLGDVQILNLTGPRTDWGLWAVGLSANLKAARGGDETFQLGPAGGFNTQQGSWTLGFFMQNFIGARESFSIFQPVVNWQIDSTWALSLSDDLFTLDWTSGRWVSTPAGLQIAKLVRVREQPLRLFASAYYESTRPAWGAAVGLTLIVAPHP
ncbi:MAG: hypothetical protein KF802_04630 [Bdellovibrionaceae bacterium]|nr:hypothetical protein [Pseudobdellovibrionaceae bacterium]MBX3033984.1 hypothetical protein [Pseudobdellovibrionaceae bacterium]